MYTCTCVYVVAHNYMYITYRRGKRECVYWYIHIGVCVCVCVCVCATRDGGGECEVPGMVTSVWYKRVSVFIHVLLCFLQLTLVCLPGRTRADRRETLSSEHHTGKAVHDHCSIHVYTQCQSCECTGSCIHACCGPLYWGSVTAMY